MIAQETFTLANGVEIPKLGLGTWLVDDGVVADLVRRAVGIGYRHVDTAQAYGNERGVGEGVRASGISRDELFITTKLAADCKTYEEAKRLIDASLETLDLGHIDLMLIHSPQPWDAFRDGDHRFEGNLEAWRALEDAHRAGDIRAIGVSNFERLDLENLFDHGSVRPVVNQMLAHVGNTPFELVDYCRGEDVLVEAYSPVAHGAVLDHPELGAMAAQYGVSVAQLCIRYCLELGMLPLPKTGNPDHLAANLAVDFRIDPDDLATLRRADHRDYGEAGRFPVFAESR